MKPPIPPPWGEPEKEPMGAADDAAPTMSDELRARIEAADYGRESGWVVEYDAQPIALFSNAQYWDMFWELWEVTPLTQEETILAKLQDSFFFDEPGVVFRNRDPQFAHLKPAWESPIVHPQTEENWDLERGEFPGNCAVVRGLYLPVPDPASKATPPRSLWERVKLYLLGA
ncbi:hypothetical protein EON83_22995 [bacterium]|nr:MAG: hypothetical protein EON83_22995 [bacterium]